jgi:hypothetical protein
MDVRFHPDEATCPSGQRAGRTACFGFAGLTIVSSGWPTRPIASMLVFVVAGGEALCGKNTIEFD